MQLAPDSRLATTDAARGVRCYVALAALLRTLTDPRADPAAALLLASSMAACMSTIGPPPPAASSRAKLLAELLAWLNERFAPDGPPIRDDTPLFVGGLLDSLRVLDLVAWTERAIGCEIPDNAIRADNFATPARIAERFATRTPDAGR